MFSSAGLGCAAGYYASPWICNRLIKQPDSPVLTEILAGRLQYASTQVTYEHKRKEWLNAGDLESLKKVKEYDDFIKRWFELLPAAEEEAVVSECPSCR